MEFFKEKNDKYTQKIENFSPGPPKKIGTFFVKFSTTFRSLPTFFTQNEFF